jgi:hypothetical protein
LTPSKSFIVATSVPPEDASEKGGKLTSGTESVLLAPTDDSQGTGEHEDTRTGGTPGPTI